MCVCAVCDFCFYEEKLKTTKKNNNIIPLGPTKILTA